MGRVTLNSNVLDCEHLKDISFSTSHFSDPTVFCWHGCYSDIVDKNDIKDFNQSTWNYEEANKDRLPGNCEQVNCTSVSYLG